MTTRVAYAPPPSPNKRNVVGFVRLNPFETVVWHWTHTHEGSFVSGYEIIPAAIPGFRPLDKRLKPLWRKANAI